MNTTMNKPTLILLNGPAGVGRTTSSSAAVHDGIPDRSHAMLLESVLVISTERIESSWNISTSVSVLL